MWTPLAPRLIAIKKIYVLLHYFNKNGMDKMYFRKCCSKGVDIEVVARNLQINEICTSNFQLSFNNFFLQRQKIVTELIGLDLCLCIH